ncbi:Rad4 beta-hairpin domain 3-domain-containing protein [Pisolithus marmoratus]|nr:Rad4 beta-hairpin domain 3-domain-containing protein [Pisolithus marmoratus]
MHWGLSSGAGRDCRALAQVKGKEKAHPVIKLCKSKSKPSTRHSTLTVVGKSKPSDPRLAPPVFWTEVFAWADSQWLPVDPIRGIVKKRHVFNPLGPQPEEYKPATTLGAKVSKAQGIVDDVEDDELHIHQLMEGMPTMLAGFKNHPIYMLARHLKRDQVIDPPTELGKFMGVPGYPRSSVISLKTAENWMCQGRTVRPGCQPMKMVKQQAVTISRQREMELAIERAKSEGHFTPDGEVMQGLYAFSRTKLYMPEPIKNGIIPQNEFGNIDLYMPSMLLGGAVHIPFKGVVKIARKLGFDYAEAMTGFEFKKRWAYPVLEGIVVAAENEGVIVEAYLEVGQDAEERARTKCFDFRPSLQMLGPAHTRSPYM